MDTGVGEAPLRLHRDPRLGCPRRRFCFPVAGQEGRASAVLGVSPSGTLLGDSPCTLITWVVSFTNSKPVFEVLEAEIAPERCFAVVLSVSIARLVLGIFCRKNNNVSGV